MSPPPARTSADAPLTGASGAAGRPGRRFVDLTRPLEVGMPVLPGDPVFTSEPVSELAVNGYEVRSLHLGSHTGTHVDAPRHVIAAGAGVDELDLGLFHGRAVVVDVRAAGPRPITGDDLAAQRAQLRPGAVLVLLTGVPEGAPDGYPWLTADAAGDVLERGVLAIGTDAPSLDPADSTDLPVHHAVLGAGGVLVENLTRIEDLLGREARLSFLPLRLTGADGSPVRAVAELLDTPPGATAPAPDGAPVGEP